MHESFPLWETYLTSLMIVNFCGYLDYCASLAKFHPPKLTRTFSCAIWIRSREKLEAIQCNRVIAHLTCDQALLFFCFSRVDEATGKKNNAWYIYLTYRQPPSNLNKQTSALPVKLTGQSAFTGGQPLCLNCQSEWGFSEVLFLSQPEKSPESGIFTCDPTKKCIMPSWSLPVKDIKG